MIPQGYSIINYIVENLMIPEQRRIETMMVDMLSRNQEALKRPLDGFSYDGFHFIRPGVTRPQAKLPIDPSLWDAMERVMQDKAMVDMDNHMLKQLLVNLIDPCTSGQEIRDALPECLKEMLPEVIRDLPREKEPAFTIANNERALRLYESLLPKLQMYATARLIY